MCLEYLLLPAWSISLVIFDNWFTDISVEMIPPNAGDVFFREYVVGSGLRHSLIYSNKELLDDVRDFIEYRTSRWEKIETSAVKLPRLYVDLER